jgi:hypothetical protein
VTKARLLWDPAPVGFDEAVARTIDWYGRFRADERKITDATVVGLVELKRAFARAPKPCQIRDLAAAARRPPTRSFPYELLANDVWPRLTRSALMADAVENSGPAGPDLTLLSSQNVDGKYVVLRLVVLATGRLMDCAVVPASQPIAPYLEQFVAPLFVPRLTKAGVTVVEVQRIVAPSEHPLRKERVDIEYAIRAEAHDVSPRVRSHLVRDRSSGRGRTFAGLVHASGVEFTHVNDADVPAGPEVVCAALGEDDKYLLVRPRPEPYAEYSGAGRVQRAAVLREMAGAAATGACVRADEASEALRSRQGGKPIENLALALAAVDAAGVGVLP